MVIHGVVLVLRTATQTLQRSLVHIAGSRAPDFVVVILLQGASQQDMVAYYLGLGIG